MRKLIVCNIMSLDGYYAGPDNNVMVLPMDQSFDAYYYNAGSYDRLFRLPKTRHYGNSNRLERPDSGWMTCHVSAKIMPSVPGRGELNITYLIVVL